MNYFWSESVTKSGEVKIGINNTLLLDFMISLGMFKYTAEELSKAEFVRKDGQFISMINEDMIKDIVIKAVKVQFKDYEHLQSVLNKLNGNNHPFGYKLLTGLRIMDTNTIKDTKYVSYNFYKNGMVVVTKEEVNIVPYDESDGNVWLTNIIDRDFVLGESGGLILQFIKNISHDEQTVNAIISSLGYLMHKYKSPSLTKMISFNDTDFVMGANGGNGKSLFKTILRQVRNVLTINLDSGKMKEFIYANVREDHDLVFLDELPPKFDLSKIFASITGEMSVEKKGKDVYNMQYEESPKQFAASNHPLGGAGGSFTGRLHEIQVNHHYERGRLQPKDDLGKEFFGEDFTEKDWRLFDNFMMYCLQYYLKNSLKSSTNITLEDEKLIKNTNEKFAEYMDDKYNDWHESEFSIRELKDAFVAYNPAISNINDSKIKGWIQEWCKVRKYEMSEYREKASASPRRRMTVMTSLKHGKTRRSEVVEKEWYEKV